MNDLETNDLEKMLPDIKGEHIALLMGGESEEADISRRSADTIYRHLQGLGLNVEKLELTRDIIRRLKEGGFTLVSQCLTRAIWRGRHHPSQLGF